jgi:formylglycine-generating enzyme
MKQKKGTMAQTALMLSTLVRPVWIVTAVVVVSAAVAVPGFRSTLLSPPNKAEAGQRMTEGAEASAFGPTIANATPVPAPPPPGMGWIPGGEFSMGALDPPPSMKSACTQRPMHARSTACMWMASG